ncbi:MAG TPA: hypothetical protein V6D14_08450 [Coleofasciculaceae cyanobacterium]
MNVERLNLRHCESWKTQHTLQSAASQDKLHRSHKSESKQTQVDVEPIQIVKDFCIKLSPQADK